VDDRREAAGPVELAPDALRGVPPVLRWGEALGGHPAELFAGVAVHVGHGPVGIDDDELAAGRRDDEGDGLAGLLEEHAVALLAGPERAERRFALGLQAPPPGDVADDGLAHPAADGLGVDLGGNQAPVLAEERPLAELDPAR